MIVDKLSRLGIYAGISDNFRTAMNFLATHDLDALPAGRNEVDGDNVYVNVADRVLDKSNNIWETHGAYTDIQLVVHGKEIIGYAFPTDAAPSKPYDPAGDCALYDDLPGIDVPLEDGEAIILFPGEPHKPGVMPDDKPARVRKLIVKVKMD